MLQSIVGPPMVGATDLKSPPERTVDKDFKGSGSESSFGKALEDKISKSLKEVKDSPQREMRQKDKEDKPQQTEAKKTEEVSKQPDGKISKKATVRQKAIQEFMDSFESEFEISPTRLVEAMAQLDEKQLAQSPEATAEAVIDQLGLSDEDASKAQAMYAGLIAQLSQMPQQQQPKPAPEMAVGAGMSQQNMQARIAAAQGKQDVMSASVDRLNKSFWMRQEPKAVPTAMPSLDASLAQKMMMDDSALAEIATEEMPVEVPEMEMPQTPPAAAQGPKLEELPPHLQGQMKETMSPALLAALAAKQAVQAKNAKNAEGSSEEAPALTDEFQQALQAPKFEKVQAAVPGQIPNVQGKASQEFFQNQSQGQSLMQQNSQEYVQKGMTGGKEAATKLVEKADFTQSLTGLEGLHGAPIKGEALKMDAAMPIAAATPTAPANPGENEAAVKQLMNQAQYLIKKGGGEMKVQMTPEGMGTIHLKVMLQDGKVNMQMSADTQEAKKTIESSLAELKTSLAAHKLSMENVKVDVVNSASADTATQNQTNMNGQNQRDQTRQFWNQFNENFGSQGRKESFAEMPNLKGYGNRGRDPLQPIETSSKARARNVEGKGSGLNLVA
ncbi:flagellar hook-length control protein FliK [Bdellovibrio bacteriovorus]|uniref:flagellar hook-length control protein FliK n=1 Tax=Bdellovibrio TaxID=958 RepID=UPI0035A8F44E